MSSIDQQLAPRELEAFVCVAEERSFTGAARRLDTSQSLISSRVMLLEEILGTRLFDRGARASRLTPAGELLLPRARRLLRLEEETRKALRDFLARPHGVLRIAASSIPGTYLLPKHLTELRRELPGVRIDLHLLDSEEALAALRAEEVELAIVGAAVASPDVVAYPVGQDEILWVCSPALAKERDPKKLPIILREPGSGTRGAAIEMLREKGIDPEALDCVLEIRGNEALCQAARASLGTTFVSRLAAAADLDRGHLVEIPGVSKKRAFYLLHRSGITLSPAAQALLRLCVPKGTAPLRTRHRPS
jgi:DNA-binding transcriptional LysR family regulator